MIQFAYTILYVPDVAHAIAFYERAFGFQRKFITPDLSYGELNTGNTTLSFASVGLAAESLKAGFIQSKIDQQPFGIEIGITTDNVEELYQKAIAEGAVAESSPVLKPHGQTVSYVRDPNGFLVEICSPMG